MYVNARDQRYPWFSFRELEELLSALEDRGLSDSVLYRKVENARNAYYRNRARKEN